MLLQYSLVQGYCYVCVTVMCCYSTVRYRVTAVCVTVMCSYSKLRTGLLLCVRYYNVLLQYSWLLGYCYVCVTVMCCYSKSWVESYCYVCYCNVLLQ